ncbi:hypothetical protein AB0K08_14085 [Citricoccus sp. NPDC055426]|uniref:hypothetical protein n=1 Tax=Citricoccus sp. NPDC055426 TaxID=3155536 RepID=UPI0034392A3B
MQPATALPTSPTLTADASLSVLALGALNVGSLLLGPLALVQPFPAQEVELARLAGLLLILTSLNAVLAFAHAGTVARVTATGLLWGTVATGLHVASYTLLGTAGRASPAHGALILALGVAAAAGFWLLRSLVKNGRRAAVLGGISVVNPLAAVAMGTVFLGAFGQVGWAGLAGLVMVGLTVAAGAGLLAWVRTSR